MICEIKGLTVKYGSYTVLNNMNLSIEPQLNVIIGPNAAGKTTLLKSIFGLLKADGNVFFDGKELRSYKREELAEFIGYLPQELTTSSALTVFEAVLLGKTNSLSWHLDNNDLSGIMAVMDNLGIDNIALRNLNELSGGQKQMVSIAQILVKSPKMFLMDEPTNNLDLQNQLEILSLIDSLTKKREITSLIILHDLNLAARYADNIIVLDGKGGIYTCGNPACVITNEMIESVYGVKARVQIDEDGVPVVTPINSIRDRFNI